MNFELVEINPEPCFTGLSAVETVVAVSSNSDRLYRHCIEVYNKPAGKPKDNTFERYYIVRLSNIKIV